MKPASRDLLAPEQTPMTRAGDAIMTAIVRNETICEETGSSSLAAIESVMGAKRHGHGLLVERSVYPKINKIYASRNPRKTVFLAIPKCPPP